MGWRNRLQQFMYGRYGMDQLNRFLSIAALVVLVVGMIIRKPWLDLIPLVLLAVCYWRMFSRNISRRYAENNRFLSILSGFAGLFGRGNQGSFGGRNKNFDYRAYREQRKIYRFFVCPGCGQKVRVPRGKGKICITCPKCRTEFIKRS